MEVCVWAKIFLRIHTKIYKVLLSKCFKNAVLGASKNGTVHVYWKICKVFEQNCIVKWVIFFASFCWLCNFLLENLKLQKKNKKKQKNVKEFQIWDFKSLYFVQIFFGGWSALGRFSQQFFVIGQPWWPIPHTIKTFPTALVIYSHCGEFISHHIK